MSQILTYTLEPLHCTYLDFNNPNTTYANSQQLYLGQGYTLLFDIPTSYIRKNSFIHSAHINLNVESAGDEVDAIASPVNSPDMLIEEATWNSNRKGSSWQNSGGDFSSYPYTTLYPANYYKLVIAASPAAYWKLDETTYVSAYDSINSSSNLNYVSSPTIGQSPIPGDSTGYSVLFNSSTSYISGTVATSTLPVSAPYSLECWINTAQHQLTGGTIFGYGSGTSFNYLQLDYDGTYYYVNNSCPGFSAQISVKCPASLGDSTWHHILSTYDGFTRTIYVDGVALGKDTPTGTPIAASSAVSIGTIPSQSYFNGYIDEPAIYNRALSAAEAKLHYNSGSSVTYVLDLTQIMKDAVNNGKTSLTFGVQKVGGSGSQVIFSSSASSSANKRPVLYISYDTPQVVSNTEYSRIAGEWLSSTDELLAFSSSPTTLALGSGTTTADPFSLSNLVNIREKGVAHSKGAGPSKAKISAVFKGRYNLSTPYQVGEYTTGSFVASEIGLYRENTVLAQSPSMLDIPLSSIQTDTYTTELLVDSPLSYWKLGESIGTIAVDSLFAYNGTYVSGVTAGSTGLLVNETETAVSFNGSNGRVTIADGSTYNFASNALFSVEAWIKPAVVTAGAMSVVCKETVSSPSNGWILGVNNTAVTFFRYGGSTSVSISGGTITTSSSYHIVGTFDGSLMSLYVNGSLVANGSYSGVNIGTVTDSLQIGMRQSGGLAQFFNGVIEKVSVFNKCLSPSRINARYLLGSVGQTWSTIFDPAANMTAIVTTGTLASFTYDPKIDLSGIGLSGAFLLDYMITNTPSYARIEIGTDANNYVYWEVNGNNFTADGVWHTLCLPLPNYQDLSTPSVRIEIAPLNILPTVVGSVGIGWMSQFKLLTTYSSSTNIAIDNIRFLRDDTDSLMVARGNFSDIDTVTPTGYEVTDYLRKAITPYSPPEGDGLVGLDSSYGIWPATTNYCTNSGFETDTSGWVTSTANVTYARVNSVQKFSKYSLMLTNTTSGGEDYMQFTLTTGASGLQPSTIYTISAWSYCPDFQGGAANNKGLAFVGTNTAGNLAATTITKFSREWERHTLTVTTSGVITAPTIRLYSPKGTVYWDGVQVEQMSVPTPYVYTNGSSSTRNAGYVQMPSKHVGGYRSLVLSDNPFLYWTCQEASGTLFDITGNQNHATALSGVTYRNSISATQAIIGDTSYSIKLANASSYFKTNANPVGLSPSAFSFTGWFKTVSQNDINVLFGMLPGVAGTYGWSVETSTSRQTIFRITDGTTTNTVTAPYTPTGTTNMFFVGVTFDGTTMSLLTSFQTSAITGTVVSAVDFATSGYQIKCTPSANGFSAEHLAAYPYALSTEQIRNNKFYGHGGFDNVTNTSYSTNAASLLTPGTGWVAFKVRPSWYALNPPNSASRYLFSWDDGTGNNGISLYFDASTFKWVLKRVQGGTVDSVTPASQTLWSLGDTITIIAYWTYCVFNTNASLNISINGGAFTTTTNASHIPNNLPPMFTLGSDVNHTNSFAGDVLWFACGNGYGNININSLDDPIFTDFPSTANCTAIWWANDDSYMLDLTRLSSKPYKMDFTVNINDSKVLY